MELIESYLLNEELHTVLSIQVNFMGKLKGTLYVDVVKDGYSFIVEAEGMTLTEVLQELNKNLDIRKTLGRA